MVWWVPQAPWAVPPTPRPPPPCVTVVPWFGCRPSLQGLTPGPITDIYMCTCYPRHPEPLSSQDPVSIQLLTEDLCPPPRFCLQDPSSSALLPSLGMHLLS